MSLEIYLIVYIWDTRGPHYKALTFEFILHVVMYIYLGNVLVVGLHMTFNCYLIN